MGEQHDALLAETLLPHAELHGHRALAQASQGVQPGACTRKVNSEGTGATT